MRAGDLQTFRPSITISTAPPRKGVGVGQWTTAGPVNWAPHNPRRAPAWSAVELEAFAHGAETVSISRWRQAPFAQEQMQRFCCGPDSNRGERYFEADKWRRN